MDFAIQPITKAQFVPVDYPYYTAANKHIGFNEETNGDTTALVVGGVQVGTPESAKVPYLPEIGKGSIKDIWA
tara:strand:+ start:69 stop:287 length:219 start_codon:yes stop_codon:yes gene_type:complete